MDIMKRLKMVNPPPIPIEHTYPHGLDRPFAVYCHDLNRGYFKTFQWFTHAQPEWIPVTELEYRTQIMVNLSMAYQEGLGNDRNTWRKID
jgi:hypothetical protein